MMWIGGFMFQFYHCWRAVASRGALPLTCGGVESEANFGEGTTTDFVRPLRLSLPRKIAARFFDPSTREGLGGSQFQIGGFRSIQGRASSSCAARRNSV